MYAVVSPLPRPRGRAVGVFEARPDAPVVSSETLAGAGMNDRWRVTVTGGSHKLERLCGESYVLVAYLDPRWAQEVVDTLTMVPVMSLQKQIAIMGDQVEDVLQRVTKLGREAR